MTIRVLVADDHPVMRIGFRALIAAEPDLTLVAEAVDGAEAVDAGACGYLIKDAVGRELVSALRTAAEGLHNPEIARAIGRSEDTVKSHLEQIMAKLRATDRTEAVTRALRRGIIHLDD